MNADEIADLQDAVATIQQDDNKLGRVLSGLIADLIAVNDLVADIDVQAAVTALDVRVTAAEADVTALDVRVTAAEADVTALTARVAVLEAP